jgi:DNA helicase-2/ATP-dependent DNA helicase PcrA
MIRAEAAIDTRRRSPGPPENLMPHRTPPHQQSLVLASEPAGAEPPDWVREEPADPEAVAQVLADLDPEQRRAVTHDQGPLLVVAGAGTGKTRVIAHRIAWLIAAKRAHPSEILALTFTERSAAEMEGRVDLLVPYGYTDMWISTFHAFGDRIYREYALELGLPDTARVLSEAERVVFFRERLFRLPLRRYLPLGNPVRHLQALVRLTARAKDEGILPERYLAHAQAELQAAAAELERAPEAGADEAKARTTARAAARARIGEAERQVELAQVYRAMEEELHGAGKIDFGDQLLLVHRLLATEPAVLAALRRRFRYILVDEFQDTNTVQFELLKLLSGGHRNLMVVGDDDQSIYRFRGAAIRNILSFTATFPDRERVVLTRNYRSGQRILDAAHRLIANNPDRLESREQIVKQLRAQAADPGAIEFRSYGALAEEAQAVAARIRELVAGGRAYREIAVLVRSNRDAEPFLSALSAAGVPHEFSGNRGLFARAEVRLAIAFLRAVTRRNDAQSLLALASAPVYGVPMADLVQLSDFARARRRSVHWALREATAAEPPAELEPLSPEGAAGLARLAGDLARWVELARERTTGELLYQFLADTGILAELSTAAQSDLQAEEQILNLGRFFTLVARYSEAAVADRAHTFVDHLELLIEAGDDPQAAEPDPDRDAVRVLTVHRAKGLEFPVVFVVNLATLKFPVPERRDAIRLPDALAGGAPGDAPEDALERSEAAPARNLHLEEERRLFYVAMTRARELLVFTTAADHGGFRARKPSPFIAEALDLAASGAHLEPAAAAREAIARHKTAAPPDPAPAPARRPSSPELPLDLSYSRIDAYEECPLRYKFHYVLRVPSIPHHSQSYGKSIHDAIEFLLRARMQGLDPPFAEVEAAYRRAWRSEGYLSREHEERRFESGLRVLVRFATAEAASSVRPAQVEKEFAFEFEGDRVNGRFDRVDLDPTGATVIDYKTSLVTESEAAERARKSLQLKLYALAYHRQAGRLPVRGELRFIEPGIVSHVEYVPADLETVAQVIRRVAAGIRAEDFPSRPAPQTCSGCAFQRICPVAVW